MDTWVHACVPEERDGKLVAAHCHLQVIGIAAGGVVSGQLSEPRRKVCGDGLVMLAEELGKKSSQCEPLLFQLPAGGVGWGVF